MYLSSLRQLSHALQNRQISSLELTRYFLQRIDAFEPQLNSLITLNEEYALALARNADKTLSHGNTNPLCGIPMVHKDLFCTRKIKTTCASKMLAEFIPPYDAHIVSRLNQAGSVMLGKTNMDEFAMGSSNETSYFGPVKNPWNLQCVPGGSSGGSAAAVGARIIPWATGSDTGGSIRQPAAFCGITGLKPTYGRVSRFGMVAFASSLDQAGAFATSADDLSLVFQVLSGFDPRDSTSVNHSLPDYNCSLNMPLKGKRIGVPLRLLQTLPNDMASRIEQCAKQLSNQGVELIDIELKHFEDCVACYYIIASAEASSNLSRFDGVRFGHRTQAASNLSEMYAKSRAEGFGEEVKRRILTGTYTLSAGYFDDYYIKAQKVRRLIRDDYLSALSKVDALLFPTTPTTAFKLGEKLCDPVGMYLSDAYTIGANLAGLPALSMPIGFIETMPAGAQLIGNHFDEATLLHIAHTYQQQTQWHRAVPTLFDHEA